MTASGVSLEFSVLRGSRISGLKCTIVQAALPMSTMIQLEREIQTLPDSDFQTLLAWMEEQNLGRLAADGYESPQLEAAILSGVEGPHHEWNDELRARIRNGWESGNAPS